MKSTQDLSASQFYEQWNITKPAVQSYKGLVASQHYLASAVGAEVLSKGGNAIDAAIATGLALGVVEPAMSGIGGGGFMTLYRHDQNEVKVVEFGMKAPLRAHHSDYPLTGEQTGSSSFNWPAVEDERNVHGPYSIAVPGYVKGVAKALERFGTWDWKEVIQPACELAERGLPTNWYMVHYITKSARLMRQYEGIREVYLSDGLPAEIDEDGQNRMPLGNLSETYQVLKQEGPQSFYTGSLAKKVVKDLEQVGSRINSVDLAAYQAKVAEPLKCEYREHEIYVPSHRSAGPTLARTLKDLQNRQGFKQSSIPTPRDYQLFTETLLAAYEYRLEHLGDGANEEPGTGATSHICVGDKHGNLVSLTQTLMSSFGSYILLPQTGVLMNNGMMWFDPRPGRLNSVAGGRYPLSNMCPTVGRTENQEMFALGACGGRQIFPAVYQLTSFFCDFEADVDSLLHHPRIDVSGTDCVTIMANMDEATIQHLEKHFSNTRVRMNGVSPVLFGVPQMVARGWDGELTGGCMIPSPLAAVIPVE